MAEKDCTWSCNAHGHSDGHKHICYLNDVAARREDENCVRLMLAETPVLRCVWRRLFAYVVLHIYLCKYCNQRIPCLEGAGCFINVQMYLITGHLLYNSSHRLHTLLVDFFLAFCDHLKIICLLVVCS